MSFPYIKQYDSMDCGPTCLAMICKHFGKSFSIQKLREKTQIGKEGVNMLGISEAAESIGFRTQSVKINIDTINDAKIPCILHWNQNHFVVLYRIKRNKYYISDPARGLIIYNKAEFKQHWASTRSEGIDEGIALLLEPSPMFFINIEESSDQQTTELSFSNILNYLLPYKKLIFQIFVGFGISSILQLILPFLTQSIGPAQYKTPNCNSPFFENRAGQSTIHRRFIFRRS